MPIAIVVALLVGPQSAQAAALVPLAPASAWSSTPMHAASPPGDPRLFVAERGGGIRVVEEGVLLPTPFLTVQNVDTSGERGLLSIAFSPDYATSGLFYVFTVAAGADELDPSAIAGDLRVVEYRRSATDPDLADPASARLVWKQQHSSGIHNGGQIAFGPEGLLYVTTGDAGTSANAQSLANDLGKVLRIDPHDPVGSETFGVPASNPFVGTGAKPEIYALGLRNPYRASFSPGGDLVLPDVGQETWEEVNLGRATGTPAATTLAGANLGWPNCEGACTTANPSFVDPIFQYGHAGPAETTGCAIIGGYVVRDPTLTGLTGRYLYGDYCRDDLRTLDLDASGADPQPSGLTLPPEELLGFGEDSRGCVYVMTDVTVYRVAASATSGTACPPPAAAAGDDRPPRLTLDKAHRRSLRRFLRVVASCDEACSLRATGRLDIAGGQRPGARSSSRARLIAASGSGAPGARVSLRLTLSASSFRRAKRARDDGRRVTARLVVTATDPSGNATKKTKRIALR